MIYTYVDREHFWNEKVQNKQWMTVPIPLQIQSLKVPIHDFIDHIFLRLKFYYIYFWIWIILQTGREAPRIPWSLKLITLRCIYLLLHIFPSCHHFSIRTLKNLISVLQCSANLLMLRMVRQLIEENPNFSQELTGNFTLKSFLVVKAVIKNNHCSMCRIKQKTRNLRNRTTQYNNTPR